VSKEKDALDKAIVKTQKIIKRVKQVAKEVKE